ncbi:MAG: hydroxymyristoyl-ACP dehydratase [Bacteroidales bacterium]|nr:hydroxymyristoyl-ACP dehydratase [Bacteroidales bacterium]
MIKGKELHSLLPQSSPMLMIDTLVSSDQEKTITNLTITEENIFCINGKFREPGIIENMAQTAAARSGFEAKKNKTPVQTGYIGSIKNLTIFFLPKINEIIETEIVQKTEIGNILVIEANVKINNKFVAKCEMTIILLDNL